MESYRLISYMLEFDNVIMRDAASIWSGKTFAGIYQKGKRKDSAKGNTFNAQKYGCPRVHHVEEDISLIFFNELTSLSLFPMPDLC